MARLHFEDFHPGDVRELGRRTITRDEIVAFARDFDPQPFHLDDSAAAASPYGGLIASGWHTASIAMRLVVDGLGETSSMGARGVDELRWHRPVRPGDTLALKCTVVEATPSRSRPDRGDVKLRYELTNQRGELVLSMIGLGLFGRRPA